MAMEIERMPFIKIVWLRFITPVRHSRLKVRSWWPWHCPVKNIRLFMSHQRQLLIHENYLAREIKALRWPFIK